MEEKYIFESEKIRQAYELAKRFAPYNTTVLLEGETGVGKEIFANLIHRSSNRAKKPFLKINCASLPESLLESELFGYEGGSFTGAKTSGSLGLFESSHEGTLLLDEISELSPNSQVKILRVLQEWEVRRIGSRRAKKIDVRIIASTNQNLWDLAKEGSFRKDLYFRLSTAHLYIPPLRERIEDIKSLALCFLNEFNKEYNMNKSFSKDFLHAIQVYYFPGNVRELKNIVEFSFINSIDDFITVNHLPEQVIQINPITSKLPTNILDSNLTLQEKLDIYEKKLIKEALINTKSIRKAAVLLGMNNSTLLRRISKYDLHDKNM